MLPLSASPTFNYKDLRLFKNLKSWVRLRWEPPSKTGKALGQKDFLLMLQLLASASRENTEQNHSQSRLRICVQSCTLVSLPCPRPGDTKNSPVRLDAVFYHKDKIKLQFSPEVTLGEVSFSPAVQVCFSWWVGPCLWDSYTWPWICEVVMGARAGPWAARREVPGTQAGNASAPCVAVRACIFPLSRFPQPLNLEHFPTMLHVSCRYPVSSGLKRGLLNKPAKYINTEGITNMAMVPG